MALNTFSGLSLPNGWLKNPVFQIPTLCLNSQLVTSRQNNYSLIYLQLHSAECFSLHKFFPIQSMEKEKQYLGVDQSEYYLTRRLVFK